MKVFLVAAFGLMCNIEIWSESLAASEFCGCMYTYGGRIYYTMIVCIKLISTKNWFGKMNGSLGAVGSEENGRILAESVQLRILPSNLLYKNLNCSSRECIYLSVDPTWWIFFSCTNAMENSTASNVWMMSTKSRVLTTGRQAAEVTVLSEWFGYKIC